MTLTSTRIFGWDLPPGVSNNDPHFGGQEVTIDAECGEHGMSVVPAKYLLERLRELTGKVTSMEAGTVHEAAGQIPGLKAELGKLVDWVTDIEDMVDFPCPFEGEIDVELVDGRAGWPCPKCASDNEYEEESGPDPDEAYERYREARL